VPTHFEKKNKKGKTPIPKERETEETKRGGKGGVWNAEKKNRVPSQKVPCYPEKGKSSEKGGKNVGEMSTKKVIVVVVERKYRKKRNTGERRKKKGEKTPEEK